METKTIKWIKPKDGKKPGAVIFQGEDFFYTIWETKGKEKGDKVNFNIVKKGEYNGKPQITIEFTDEVPETDIYSDMPKNERQQSTNSSIENQVLIKCVAQIFESAENVTYDDIDVITEKIISAWKKIENRNNTPEYTGDEYPHENTEVHPF